MSDEFLLVLLCSVILVCVLGLTGLTGRRR